MKKHTKQIVSGIILFVLGAIVIPTVFCIIAYTCYFSDKPLARFTTPDQLIISIEKASRYYLWNDVHTVFDGKSYPATGEFPEGLEISLSEKLTGQTIEFVSEPSITSFGVDSIQNSVGYFEVDKPGLYLLEVRGDVEPIVCSFGKSIFSLRKILIFFGTFAVTMLTGIVGFILVIIGIVNVVKAKKKSLGAGSSPA